MASGSFYGYGMPAIIIPDGDIPLMLFQGTEWYSPDILTTGDYGLPGYG
jgi:hypothetical protein